MQPAERNYEIYDKELLAIVEALAKWRQYLLDAAEPFEVWIDHKNFRELHKLNEWQARWYLKLQDYDFTLKHILGKTNTKVDILSWKYQINTKKDNKDVQLLKDEIWTRKMTAKVIMLERMMTEESDIIKRIQRNNTREKKIVQVLEKNNRSTWEEERVVYIEERIYVLNNKEIREEILKEHHDPADIGHPRQLRMMEILKRTYWWPGLKEDIKKYVQGYFKYQQNKV